LKLWQYPIPELRVKFNVFVDDLRT